MPSEWPMVKLDQIFGIATTACFPQNQPKRVFNHYSLPSYDLTGGCSVEPGSSIESNKTLIANESILVSKLNPRKPRVQLAQPGNSGIVSCASTEFIVYEPKTPDIALGFYAKYFASGEFARRLEQVATGTTNSHVRVKPKDTLAWSVPFPPLPEQRRIADILDTLDRTIEGTQRIIAKLQAARQGLLHDLLTRGLDEHGQLRDPKKNPELFKDTVLGRVPRDWEVKPIGDITSFVGSGVTPTGGSKVYRESGVTFIRSQNVTHKGLVLDDVAFISRQIHDVMRRTSVEAFDTLLNITGASIGRCCWVPEGIGDANVNQHVCIIRLPSPNKLDAIYLSEVLSSPIGQLQIERLNAGGNREGLNFQQLRGFTIPWPVQSERIRIAQAAEFQGTRLSAEQAQLAKLHTLKRGLMEDLLTGRVRVPVGESEPGKQVEAEPEPPANIPFEPPFSTTLDPAVHFRASAGADPIAQADWVAQAREIAARQQVAAYSREALAKAVHDLAELSRTLDGILQVPDVLKAAGVRFVLLKHPKGSKTSGAAFWLDAGAKSPTQPVVALSMRYPHIDVFWFNLFHELGHIWHNHAAVMGEELVTYSDPAPAEQEAHAYAREALIPDAVWQPYLHTGNHTMRGILAFAGTVGRHHATVAGRLCNDLKDFARFNSGEHRPSIPKDLFDRLLLRLGGSL